MTSSQTPAAETVNVRGVDFEFDGTRTYTARTATRVYTIANIPGSTHHVLTDATASGIVIDTIEFDTFFAAATMAAIKISR